MYAIRSYYANGEKDPLVFQEDNSFAAAGQRKVVEEEQDGADACPLHWSELFVIDQYGSQ